jgi:hypothetical protein
MLGLHCWCAHVNLRRIRVSDGISSVWQYNCVSSGGARSVRNFQCFTLVLTLHHGPLL